jgi:hypothetical protein
VDKNTRTNATPIINSDSSLKVGKKKPFILSRSNLMREIIPLLGHFEKPSESIKMPTC